MAKITISINNDTAVTITETFDSKDFETPLDMLKASVEWLKLGTPLEGAE